MTGMLGDVQVSCPGVLKSASVNSGAAVNSFASGSKSCWLISSLSLWHAVLSVVPLAARRGACAPALAAAVLAGPVTVRAVLLAAGDARLAYWAGADAAGPVSLPARLRSRGAA